jgi:fructose-specific phosphotransferase system IIC component
MTHQLKTFIYPIFGGFVTATAVWLIMSHFITGSLNKTVDDFGNVTFAIQFTVDLEHKDNPDG